MKNSVEHLLIRIILIILKLKDLNMWLWISSIVGVARPRGGEALSPRYALRAATHLNTNFSEI
jgi:hypothetical protein